MPAEWTAHEATWTAWPSHGDLWQDNLVPARAAFTRMVGLLAEGERVDVLVPDAEQEALARAALPAANVSLHRVPFGDIWLRDTAPIFVREVREGRDEGRERGQVRAVRFGFNGWGGKFELPFDDQVSGRIATIFHEADGTTPDEGFRTRFVLEGGAVDVDGEGAALTTRQCMLNENRNGPREPWEIEAPLREFLGVERVHWFGDGLVNDHTDGHVDTLVRFVRPGVVVAMEPRASDDPNREALRVLLRDAAGQGLDVQRVPSPGRITDPAGKVMPASYVNFVIGNAVVVVPTYGSPFDDEAVERIGALFPGRRTIGVEARAILSGGGAFHCITQQQPRAGTSA